VPRTSRSERTSWSTKARCSCSVTAEPSSACSREYDRTVAGVVSGGGGLRPGFVLGKREDGGARVPVALLGRVFCKVDADYAPLGIGDLLTTSPTAGHAMKSRGPQRSSGAVIGKAIEGLASGRGLVPILVALQ
jgi:hypothetical protein